MLSRDGVGNTGAFMHVYMLTEIYMLEYHTRMKKFNAIFLQSSADGNVMLMCYFNKNENSLLFHTLHASRGEKSAFSNDLLVWQSTVK